VVQARFPTLQNKRICLLIAHPDDEAMFFAPTVLALTRPETGNHVKILCLSTGTILLQVLFQRDIGGGGRSGVVLMRLWVIGNADGLGETRKRELVKSGMLLGLRDEDDVFIVDEPYASPSTPDETSV
jgi:N-acetylglucosaminylphosphatidylinositol deacetylase